MHSVLLLYTLTGLWYEVQGVDCHIEALHFLKVNHRACKRFFTHFFTCLTYFFIKKTSFYYRDALSSSIIKL